MILTKGWRQKRQSFSFFTQIRCYAATFSLIIFPTICTANCESTSFIQPQSKSIITWPEKKAKHSVNETHRPIFNKDATVAYNKFSMKETSRNYVKGKLAQSESSSTPPMSDFERRMRNQVQNQIKSKKRPRYKLPPNVRVVKTLEEYRDAIVGEKHRLVATRFYAPYCKACKAIEPYFYRLATIYPDVSFIEVPVSEDNANLHKGLNVPSVPFGHIYHPDIGLVEERRITKKRFRTFQHILDIYVQGMWETNDFDYSDPFAEQKTAEA